jgi:hypothetical protein
MLAIGCDSGVDHGAPSPSQTARALSGSTFESTDGDLVVSAPGATDWGTAPALVVGRDRPTGQTDDALGQGAKEDIEAPTVVTGSIPNNKSDLLRWYVAHELNGTDTYLYLAWVRANVLGTANLNFEFNQSSVLSANGVTPVRSAGDMLITFDWDAGGHRISLGLLSWVTTGSAAACFSAKALPCWGHRIDLNAAAAADGAVNELASVYDPIVGATLPAKTFGEAAINLNKAGFLDPTRCVHFGRAFVKSRSSTSFTAELKDFIAPVPVSIDNCKPAHVILKKLDPAGNPLAGASMELYLDDGDGTLDAGDVLIGACTTGADGIGDCTFTVTESGTYIGHETVAPPGYNPAPDQSVVITIGNEEQTVVLTFTNSPAPGRINVQKTDDLGAPLAGATFALLVDNAPTGTAPGNEDTATATCTTDAAGTCAFEDVPLGSYWVVEVAVPPGYFDAVPPYQAATVGLGSEPGQGATVNLVFVDARKFRVIVIVCQGSSTLYPSTVSVDGLGSQTTTGLIDPAICTLATGNFSDLANGAHTCSIDIPTSP